MAQKTKDKDGKVPGNPKDVKPASDGRAAFETATASGRPSPFRFSSARSVREIFTQLKLDDAKEADRRRRIKRAYDGCRPFDPKKLAAAGLKHRANLNTMGLKGQIDARVAAVQDMALDTTDLVELRPVDGNLASPEAERISSVVAREFSATLRSSRRFLNAMTSLVKESELYGLGPMSWPDYKDYEPIALDCGQLKYMEDASSVSSENELYMIEAPISAGYLFGLIADKESKAAAEKQGWNIAAVQRMLHAHFVEGQAPQFESGDYTQTSVIESSLALYRQSRNFDAGQFRSANVIHAYAREVSGSQKITHYIVSTTGEDEEFVLRRPEAYEHMDQCMIWLTYTAGERYARALRGLASYLLPMEDFSNRLLCRTLDAASLAAGYILTGSNAARQQRLTVFEHGPYTVIPDDVKPAQAQVSPQFQQIAAVREMTMNAAYNNATGARGPAASPERVYSGADRKTRDQVQAESSAGARVEKSLFVLRSTCFDAIFRECFRRFINIIKDPNEYDNFPAVKEFIERCKRQRVALADLKAILSNFTVYMCRDLVTGGADAKGNALEQILSVTGGNMDELGRLNATYDLITCRLGTRSAERYRPIASRDTMPSDAASFAQMENNDMMELANVLVASDQLHWSHIRVHGELLQQIMQQVQQNQIEDPQRTLDTLQLIAEHIREHLGFGRLQTGMEPRAKQIEQGLRSLHPYIKMLTMQAAAIQKQQDAQERQQQIEMDRLREQAEGKDAETKIHEIDTKAALKLREQDLDHEVKMVGVSNKAVEEGERIRNKAQLDTISANAKRLIEAGSITGSRRPNAAQVAGSQPLPLGAMASGEDEMPPMDEETPGDLSQLME